MTKMIGGNDFLYYVTGFCDVINEIFSARNFMNTLKLSYYLLGPEPTPAELGRMAENHG